MMDFNIQYGLSTEIFINGQLNPDLIIEEGCWYLCTDTAELFLGVYDTDENGQRFLTLKIINEASGDFITPAELEAYGFITEQYIAGKQDTIADLDAIRAGAALGKTALQTIPEEYVTETELANKGYITNVSDKADIDHKHEEYALAEHEHNQYLTEQDISGKADKSELFSKDYNELINKPVIPSIEGLATEEYVDNAIREAELSGKEVDLSAYATKAHVAEEIAKIEIPTIPDLTDYAKKSDIPGVSDFIEAIPGEYITESELAAKGFITSTADKADKEHTHSYNELTDRPEIPEAYDDNALRTLIAGKADSVHIHEEYADLNHKHTEYAEAAHEHAQYLTGQSLTEYVKKSELPSHEGLATEEYVNNALNAIPKTDLTNYYNKTEVENLISGIEHPVIPTKVSELDNDAKYATEQYVIDAIAAQVPVENLVKKEELQEVKTKLETEVIPIVQETIIPVVRKSKYRLKKIIVKLAGKYDAEIRISGKQIIIERFLEEGKEKDNEPSVEEGKKIEMAQADRMIDQISELLQDYINNGRVSEHITASKRTLIMEEKEFECITGLLDDSYKNVRMASFAIDCIIDSIEDKSLEDLLRKQNKFYLSKVREIEDMSKEFNHKLSDINMFLKGSSLASIKMKTMFNGSKNHIAEMMIKGTIMGINELTAMQNESSNLEPEIKQFVCDLLKLEESYNERLKAFL